jgi:hypothetical protein
MEYRSESIERFYSFPTIRVPMPANHRPLCARSGQSGMTLCEIMAHFLITCLERLSSKPLGNLAAAKERADREN